MKASQAMTPVKPLLLSTVNMEELCSMCDQVKFIPVVDAHGRYAGSFDSSTLTWLMLGQGVQKLDLSRHLVEIPCVPAETEMDVPDAGLRHAVVVDSGEKVIGVIVPPRNAKGLYHIPTDLSDWLIAIINSSDSGIIAVDELGNITLMNTVAEEILGVARVNAIGSHITKFSPNSMMPRVLESREPLRGQKIQLGDKVTLTNYSPIIVNGKFLGAVAVFQDISNLEMISLELNIVKSLLRENEAIVDSSYDGIFITDGNGIVLQANRAYERMTGIKAGEVVGKDMRRLVEEKYYDESVTLIVMERHEPVTITQTLRNGLKLLVTGNPVFNDEGELFRVVTNVRNITELITLQDKLKKTKEQSLKYEAELSHLRSLQIEDKDLVYSSPTMDRIVELAIKIAYVDSTVLLLGETGTGKELIAKLIHKTGKGLQRPFIKINCATIPEPLLESELFGYESGAFTGANRKGKMGLFELAHSGTLFLDEVADLPLSLQAKILRAIQEKEILRLGGGAPITINVRIIAATHRDIGEMLKKGSFRRDLYYRLMVVPIHLPPLRERKEDIPVLVKHFMDKFNRRFGYQKTISHDAMDKLMAYSWPGNVRELENLIERLMVTGAGDELTPDFVPEHPGRMENAPERGTKLRTALEQAEAHLLNECYKEYASWSKVAVALGVDRSTIFRKASKYGFINKS